MIWAVAANGDVNAIKVLASSGVDVTGSLTSVSICVAIQYSVVYVNNGYCISSTKSLP